MGPLKYNFLILEPFTLINRNTTTCNRLSPGFGHLASYLVKALSTSPQSLTPTPSPPPTPFFEYSSLYWGTHTHKKKDLLEQAKLLALKLFDDCNNRISTKSLLKALKLYVYLMDFDRVSLFPLQWSTIFNYLSNC